jgi:hypothetical protein
MSKTATHIAQPARHGDWGLTVDKLSKPSQLVVIRYPNQGRRHSEPSTVALRLPYIEDADTALAELVEKAEMPRPTAISLVMALSAKLESPKVGDADTAVRPTA